MAAVPKHFWQGASGKNYEYEVYPLGTPFSNVDGNYIYAKTSQFFWLPVYIGQGDLSVRISTAHHQSQCVAQKQATHIHVHANPNRQDRIDEEQDILAAFPLAYAPTGCNEKIGG